MPTFLATTPFGLEGIAARELRGMGLSNVQARNGGATFTGEPADAARANLWLRCADRVRMVAGQFQALTFDQLFEGVRALPWADWLPRDACFPVSGKCVRAQLMSVPDCQSIVKKAIVSKLQTRHPIAVFPETGALFPIEVSLRGGEATVTLDTTGDALHRRGYRTWNGEAPLRETLAAALVLLSDWTPGQPLHDPMCGTGTIALEAAWIAARRAPGLTRAFACERWPGWERAFGALREEARARVSLARAEGIAGEDLDPAALELARRHARQAGVEGLVRFDAQDAATLARPEARGAFVCNPPYGVRLGDDKDAARAIRTLRGLWNRHPGWSIAILSAHPGFEQGFGARADRKPRVYNGRLECALYVYRARS